MNDEQKRLMTSLQELCFACLDLQLFLDTHPNNQQALQEFNKYSQMYGNTKKEYEQKYGPLTNFGYSKSSYPWQWVMTPWPWEQQ